jgi:hypothetical protein
VIHGHLHFFAAETYAPEYLSTVGQPRKVIADICGEFFHRDQAVMIGIDVAGARQRVEQDLGKGAMLPFLILTPAHVRRRGRRQNRPLPAASTDLSALEAILSSAADPGRTAPSIWPDVICGRQSSRRDADRNPAANDRPRYQRAVRGRQADPIRYATQ